MIHSLVNYAVINKGWLILSWSKRFLKLRYAELPWIHWGQPAAPPGPLLVFHAFDLLQMMLWQSALENPKSAWCEYTYLCIKNIAVNAIYNTKILAKEMVNYLLVCVSCYWLSGYWEKLFIVCLQISFT